MAVPSKLTVADRLGADAFASDKESHLRVDAMDLCRSCVLKPCIQVCPAEVYQWDQDRLKIRFENCLELGACRIACQTIGNGALIWAFPRGTKGIQYRYG
jgi:ferredoxin like protein